MRVRITILCGFLLFSVMSPTPAVAGPWSAFISWLSDLDPKSGGIGVEMTIWCPPSTGSGDAKTSKFTCNLDGKHKVLIKASTAVLFGTLNENGGTIFVVPVLGIVEKRYEHVYLGAGIGFVHVGGTLGGGVTQPLIQPVRVTIPIPKIQFGVRAEVNVIPNGFPAGAFGAGKPATGTELAWGVSFVYLR